MNRFLRATALGLVLATAAWPAWAQDTGGAAKTHLDYYRGDVGHTGYTAEKAALPLSMLWRHTITPIPDNPASPVYSSGTVYFAAGARVYALNASDGTRKWRFPADADAGAPFKNTPALAGGALYIGGDDSHFYKLDAQTGKQIWSRTFPGTIRSAPVIDGDLVFFGGTDGTCYALDTTSGRTRWTFDTQGSIATTPTFSGGQLVVETADNQLYCINASNGRREWSVQLPAGSSLSAPSYGDSTLYLGAGDTLYALRGRSGEERWHKSLSSEISTPAAVTGDTVYVGTQDSLVYAFNLQGRLRWTATLEVASYAPPFVAGNVLIVPAQRGLLYGIDVDTGKIRWEYVIQPAAPAGKGAAASTDVNSSPIFVDNTLFVLSDDGTISAFRPDALDTIGPLISGLSPMPAATVAGNNLAIGVSAIDEGSGINPATVLLTLDGRAIPKARYLPLRNRISVDAATLASTLVPTLRDGPHQVMVSVADWRGNVGTRTWAFLVDNRYNPAGAPAPSDLPPATAPGAGDGGRNNQPPPPPPI